MNRSRVRRSGIGVAVGLGTLILPATALGAPADHHASHVAGSRAKTAAAVGSGLGSVDTNAIAYAVRMPFYSHSGEDVEGESPYALSSLGLGGSGHAVTSVFWPGDTGAHGGDIVDLLQSQIPVSVPDAVKKGLNDPEKAEAQSSVGKPVVKKDGPGFTMVATAKPALVSADSHAGGSAVPVLGNYFGETSAKTSVAEKGAKTVVLSGISSVHNVNIGGVVKIDSVTSTTRAVTAATKASGKSDTVISGAAVAGVPVVIDGKGVHASKGAPSIPLVTPDDVVNKALKQSGISLHTTPSQTKVAGSTVSVTAGTLVIGLGNSGYTSGDNDTATVLILGGGQLDGSSTPSFGITSVTPPANSTTTATTTTTRGTAGTPGTPGTPGTAGTSASTTGGSAGGEAPQVADTGQTADQAISGALSASNVALPGGVKAWWAVLALVAAGLMAFGLRRLPDHVLEGPAATCSLED